MEEKPIGQLEEKVQLLINKYRTLKENYTAVSAQRDNLEQVKENNYNTINQLKEKIDELEKELLQTMSNLEDCEKKCTEYEHQVATLKNNISEASSRLASSISDLIDL